jgi:exodeoxyribonuclease III
MMTLKVLAYNICQGGEDRLTTIAEVIRTQRPDAAALLEAIDRAKAETLARNLGMHLVFGAANNGVHVAWLSHLPIRRWENYCRPALAKTLLEIEVAWAGGSVRLFATHLASRHDATTPAEEVPTILAELRSLRDQPHLLVGDFNALRPGDPVGTAPSGVAKRGDALDDAPRRAVGRILADSYVDCYRAMHPWLPGYTYPSEHPWLRLDYVFASPTIATRLLGCDLVTGERAKQASDHLPIWAEFREAAAFDTVGRNDQNV